MGDIFSAEAIAAMQGVPDSGAGSAADNDGTPADQQSNNGDGGKPSGSEAQTPDDQQAAAEGAHDGTEEGGTQEEAKPFFEFKGRAFKDANELMTTMESSQKEALRLKGAERQLKTLTAAQQDLMVKHRAELAKIQLANFQNARYPGEKSAAELEQMAPAELNAYYKDRASWEVKRDADKQQFEAALRADGERAQRVQQEIAQVTEEMCDDPENYPDFEVLTPTVNALSKDFGFACGHPETPKLFYFAALGARALFQQSQGKTMSADARKGAAQKAAADAAARGGGVPPSSKGKKPASSGSAVDGMLAAYKRSHGSLG